MLDESAGEWWGYSRTHGWVVVDWNDPRNRPGYESSRKLHLVRCRDWGEAAIPWLSWPSECVSGKDRLNSVSAGSVRQQELDAACQYQQDFYRLHCRLDAVRPLLADYVPFAAGKRLFDLCDRLAL